MNGPPLLEIRSTAVSYGRIRAVRDVSLTVNAGEMIALIGANGAGKTTVLCAIMGLLKLAAGDIRFNGLSIANGRSDYIVDLGLALVPEARQLFSNMTVMENLEVALFNKLSRRLDRHLLRSRIESVYELFPRIAERRHQLAGTLSGGEQQMVAIGRALMSDPKMLLLDEPSLGLSPVMMDKIVDILQLLHRKGLGVLLVEQNAQVALEISDRAYVIETGEISLSGKSSDLLNDPRVQQAYLGI